MKKYLFGILLIVFLAGTSFAQDRRADFSAIGSDTTEIPNLIGHWALDGNALDSSGNGNNGSVVGATPTTDRFGVANRAYFFDGSSQYISIADDISLRPANEMTISVWVKPDHIVAEDRYIIGKRDSYSLDGMRNYDTRPHFYVFNSAGANGSIKAGTKLNVGEWNHIVGIYEGSTISMYVNGIQTGSSTFIGGIGASTSPIYIGTDRYRTLSTSWKGGIDDVRIYDRKLSASEIQQIYTMTEEPPVGSFCGDGTCDAGENSTNCPGDCPAPPPVGPVCGDGTCDAGEDSNNCPGDCPAPPPVGPVCGDGTCDAGEDSNNCPGDCPAPPPVGPVCGDGTCDAGENSTNCAGDCPVVSDCPEGATCYYINANGGSDSNNGLSEANALKNFSGINWSQINPGNYILLKRGEEWREQLTVQKSGSSGNPITIGAYGTGNKPVINGSGTRYSAIVLSNRSYITVDGIETRECSIPINAYSNSAPSTNLKITNSSAYEASSMCLRFVYVRDSLIESCSFKNSYGSYVVQVYLGTNVNVRKNTFANPDGKIGTLFQYLSVSNSIFEYNDLSGNCNNATYVRVENPAYPSNNIKMRYNKIHDIPSQCSIMQHRCDERNIENLEIYGNVIVDCPKAGPAINVNGDHGFGVVGVKIYNNSIHVTGNGIHVTTWSNESPSGRGIGFIKDCEVYNNIIQCTGQGFLFDETDKSELTSDNNIFRTSGTLINMGGGVAYTTATFSTYQSTYSKDLNSLTSDPRYTNPGAQDLTLQPGSPAINSAKSLSGYNYRLKPGSTWPHTVMIANDSSTIGAYAHE